MIQTGKQHKFLLEATARIFTGETVAFIGLDKVSVEKRLQYLIKFYLINLFVNQLCLQVWDWLLNLFMTKKVL